MKMTSHRVKRSLKKHLNRPPFLINQKQMPFPQSLSYLMRRSLLRLPQMLTKSKSSMFRNQ